MAYNKRTWSVPRDKEVTLRERGREREYVCVEGRTFDLEVVHTNALGSHANGARGRVTV